MVLVVGLAPGFHGATRDLTVRLVQIMFPGVALLVLSAWCLGVQNSHRKFFLSYVSPVVWNAVVIAAGPGTAALAAGTPQLMLSLLPLISARGTDGANGARGPFLYSSM